MVKPAAPESHEQRCPSCGVAFRLADRRKRVQCPHCLEVVDIAGEKPATRAAATAVQAIGAKELADLKARLARVDQLEARVAALEQAIDDLRNAAPAALPTPRPEPPPMRTLEPADAPRPVVEKPPEPAPKLIWHEPRLRDIASAADEMPAAQHAALVANLAAIGSRRILIQAAADDASAALRAARFHEIFEEAKWIAPPVAAAPERLCSHPLALVAQAGSSPQEMAALFMALAAAGFQPVSLIDATMDGNAPILTVGAQP